MIVLREPAWAKINLYLHVLGKRPDGYHLLDSLVVFADIGDRIEAVLSDHFSMAIEGPYGGQLSALDNSVLKAARLLAAHAGVTRGAAMTLHKNLPVASGMGGGSADAAATLRLLARLWNINISEDEWKTLGLSLGADVPACLVSEPLYMSGIGEVIEKSPAIAGAHLLLVNPLLPLSTASVFQNHSGVFNKARQHKAAFSTLGDCLEFLQTTHNDLEAPAITLMPEIAVLLAELSSQEGCMLSRMSGSGATCYGLFGETQSALGAAAAFEKNHPNWWIRTANIR